MKHLKEMKTCITSLFALLFIVTQTLTVHAAGTQYNGELQMFGDVRLLGVNMYVSYLPDADDTMEYIQMNYKGSGGSSIGIATQKGYGYDGRLEVYATYTKSEAIINGAAEQSIEYYISDVNAPEGINITAHIVGRNNNEIKVRYLVEFDNYVAKASNVLISYTDNFSQDFFFYAMEDSGTIGNLGKLFYSLTCTASDWAGDLMEYADPTEMPGAEWQNVAQNEEIITAIENTNVSLIDTIKAAVTNLVSGIGEFITKLNNDVNGWFDTIALKIDKNHEEELAKQEEISQAQLNQDASQFEDEMQFHWDTAQNEYNQSSEQHDELINGYDTSNKENADNAITDFNAFMEEEEQFSGELLNDATELIPGYTLPEEFKTDNYYVLSGLHMIPYCMQYIFDNSGVFQIIISVFFSLYIATFVLRVLLGE